MILRDTHPKITLGLVSSQDEGSEGLRRDIERIWDRIGTLSDSRLEEFGLAENGDSQSGRKVIFHFVNHEDGEETRNVLREIGGGIQEDLQERWDIFQSCLRFGQYKATSFGLGET
ncbi:hypothetical protein I302_103216 [Kwoniella bestiolae CBS 10118]|uniref:Uncharacterized protein n=1 Tax=Kwoniella bestiolae CBS 10118 TaxID=1296100 RepID=A0A1B9G7X4_9TREE|nr:hypothetical protein I302_01915 [Kwoniella bestiolae CBS 10118]OCF27080.1 hypothetical protein I302_01915 [Kwoniella bestiolae CBS 10118]